MHFFVAFFLYLTEDFISQFYVISGGSSETFYFRHHFLNVFFILLLELFRNQFLNFLKLILSNLPCLFLSSLLHLFDYFSYFFFSLNLDLILFFLEQQPKFHLHFPSDILLKIRQNLFQNLSNFLLNEIYFYLFHLFFHLKSIFRNFVSFLDFFR